MKAVVAGLVGLALCASPVVAGDGHDCGLAESAVGAVFPIRFAAKAIAETGRLSILVAGAGSSMLPGPDGAAHAYPARLQAALAQKWPKVTVTVATDTVARRTSSEMLARFKPVLAESRARLVVWQTGTNDAVRGVDPDSFSSVLDRGVDVVHAAGADIVFMNMQYSPMTESMIAVSHYAEAMRWVALQREVSLFDRFSVMKTWSELGIFDLRHATNKLDTAQRVHDCIGRLLADLIAEAVGQAGGPGTTSGSDNK